MSRQFVRRYFLSRPAQAAAAILTVLLAAAFLANRAAGDSSAAASLDADFRLLSAPARLSNGMWRVTWQSIPGRTYLLQRAAEDNLNATNWIDLQQIVASAALTSIDDTNSPAGRRYYRVRLEPEAPSNGPTFDLTRNPDYFVAVDANGLPIHGQSVTLNPDGSLPAFEFRPAGPSSAGAGQGLFIRFGAGARIGTNNGVPVIEFTSGSVAFGPRSAFQLAAPLAVSNAVVRRLPVRGMDVPTLLNAFGIAPTNGLELKLFGKFPLKILAGTFNEAGLRGARLVLLDASVPLPGGSHTYANFTLELEPDGSVKIPFSGAFAFDGGTGHGAQLNVPPARPLWLELRADGGIGLGGRADLTFTPGPSFSVDFLFDDPKYELSMSAKGLHFPLISTLAQLFPESPAPPGGLDPTALRLTTEQLRCYQNALSRLTTVSLADTPFDDNGTTTSPPKLNPGPSSALEAWSHAGLCGTNLDANCFSNAIPHAAQVASALRNLKQVLDVRLTLLRLKVGFLRGGFVSNPAVEAMIDAALIQVTAAVTERAHTPGTIRSLGNFFDLVKCLLEQESLTQRLGLEANVALTAAMRNLFARYTTDFTDRLQVTPGAFSAPTGAAIAAMDRRESSLTLTQVVQIVQAAQLVGLDADITAPMGEAIGQLAHRLWTITDADLTAAETAADYTAFLDALKDALEIVSIVQSGVVPAAALAGLPNENTLSSLATRLGAVFDAETQREANAAQARQTAAAADGAAAPPYRMATPARRTKIVGGNSAALPIPYQAAIVGPTFDSSGMREECFCGGSIIGSRWILTAAHCLTGKFARDLGVLIATVNLDQPDPAEYFGVKNVIRHPFYQSAAPAAHASDYDVAILELDSEINFDQLNDSGLVVAEPIRLLTSAEGALELPPIGTIGRISGWGSTMGTSGPYPSVLQYADVPVGVVGPWTGLNSRTITAGDPPARNACFGDSGGPLVVQEALAGVTSFVHDDHCATSSYPTVFMRVSKLEPWVKHITGLGKLRNVARAAASWTTAMSKLPPNPKRSAAFNDRVEAQLAAAAREMYFMEGPEIVETISLGMFHARLRDTAPLDSPAWWEYELLPRIIDHLRGIGADSMSLSDWEGVMNLLLQQADWESRAGGSQAQRQQYLIQAARLAVKFRESAGQVWDNYLNAQSAGTAAPASARRTKTVSPQAGSVVDMILPGDLFIDHVAGALQYDRAARYMAGSFSGKLRLPKFDLSFTVNNASLNSYGAFDLNAYGQVGLGTPENRLGTLSVPGRRPLHLSFTPPKSLTLAGGAQLALKNGMKFEAHASLADPVYEFGMSAAGLKFDLATNVFGYIPVLGDNAIENLAADARLVMNDYLQSMSASIEPLSTLADPPQFAPIGSPPDFSESVIEIPGADLNGAANGLLFVLAAPAALGYFTIQGTLPVLTNIVRDMERELERAKRDIANARSDLAQAAADTKEEARAALIRKLRDTGRGLVKAAEAGQRIRQQQTAGTLPNEPGVNPSDSPQTQQTRDETAEGIKDAAFTIPPSLRLEIELGLMGSTADYISSVQLAGGETPADFDLALQTYVQNARTAVFDSYGMDGQGNIVDSAKFNTLTENQLKEAAELSAKLAEVGQKVNQPDALQVHQRVARATLGRRHNLVGDRYRRALQAEYPAEGEKNVDGLKQEKLIEILADAGEIHTALQQNGIDDMNLVSGFDGSPGDRSAAQDYSDMLDGFTSAYGKLAGYIDPGSALYSREYTLVVRKRIDAENLARLKAKEQVERLEEAKSRPSVPPSRIAALQTSMNLLAKAHFTRLQQSFTAAGSQFDFTLNQAVAFGRDLIGLATVLENTDTPVPAGARTKSTVNNPQLDAFCVEIFPAYTIRITALAEAQKAWWVLGRASEVMLDGLKNKVANDFTVVQQASFRGAQDSLAVTGQLLEALRGNLKLRNQLVGFALPGDVNIERIHGDVFYNRSNGYLRGTFGGRIEFPDMQGASFEISRATLDNHLAFSIAAATEGPLPFGGARASASVTASGGTNQPFDFRGTGTLSLTNGADLAVSVAFNTGTRELSFDTQAGDLEDWRLSDNLVLFDAGFGFTVRPSVLAGELRMNGAAGFFAKGTLPATNQPLSRTNFHLFAENVRAAASFESNALRLVFSNGTLHLPTFFYPSNMSALCSNAPATAGPSIALHPANPIQATVHLTAPPALPRVDFSGELDFRHFGFEMPGIPGLAAAVCSARLRFSDDTLPYLTNVNASLQIPLPRSTNHVDLENGVFTLTGYPGGRIELREDLPLVDLAGFKVIVLGQGHPDCPQGSGLTVFPATGFQNLPAFQIDGGLRVEAPASMLTGVTNDAAFGLACGGISITNGQFPRLHLDALAFGGTFHIGGAGGLLLSNAAISFSGVEHAIDPSEQNPFVVRLGGTLSIPNGPALSLDNARFTFVAYDQLPRFAVDGIGFDATQFDLVQGLPAGIDKAYFTLKNSNLPLPHVLNPTNVNLSLSAFVNIPPGEDKFIGGRIDNINVTIGADGIPRMESIAGLLLEVGSISIPPIEEFGAKLYIGGLENLNPSEMYFVGRGAGSYQGYKLKLMMAFNLAGPIGMCIDVNAGAAGIPLGQTTFLFTGAGGGVSFLNNGADPCEFTTYVDPDGKPLSSIVGGFPLPNVMDWATLKTTIDRMQRTAAAYASSLPPITAGARATKDMALQANGFDCPGGCPPPTVNIFCQPHPDPVRYPNRVIMKFTSIDEPTLNNVFQITPENMAALGSGGAQVAANFAHQVRLFVETNIPPFDAAFAGNTNAIRAAVTETLDAMEGSFSAALGAILSTNNVSAFYGIIRDIAYVGAPCPDITMKVFGTFSQAAVSSFLSATVGGQITTAGNAGVFGNVNFLGIPVGKGKLFVAATDDRGLPNPSACGEIEVAFGPLELGLMRGEMSCRDCVTGILREFYKLAQCLSEPVLRQLASNAAPRLAALNLPPAQLLNQMTDVEKLGFMAEVYQLPPGVVAGLPQCFITQFQEAMEVFQPYMVLCGAIEPRLFGLPLMGGRLAQASVELSKTNIAGLTTFSPSQMLAWAINGATATARQLFPFEDVATVGFNLSSPDPAQALLAGMEGKLSSSNAVATYALQQFDQMLQRASYVMQFELKPLGGKGLDTQARIVMPNFTNHPALPGSTWDFPDRVNPNLPSREDLLLALLEQDKLVDPFWTGDNMADVDPRLNGYNLRKDYFPHGGFMGAAKIAMPRALTETPPAYLPALLNPDSTMTPLDRLLNGLDYAQNYLFSFTNRGSLAFYVPSPNPPFFTNSAGQNIGPREMLEAIASFDFKSITNAQIASLYPFEAGFVKGYFNATLLGVPMATGVVVALPPAPEDGRPEAVMRLEVAATPQGWMSYFVTTNNLIVEMRGAPPRPIESWANEVVLELASLAVDPSATEAQIQGTVTDLIGSIETNLPKMRLEADLQFGFPAPINDLVSMRGTARLHAYSPKYDPGFEPQNTSPMARIKREGGIAFEGNARLKVGTHTLADIDAAEFSLVPRGEGLPEIAARLVADTIPFPPDLPITTFRNVNIDFATAPQPYFRGSGRLDFLALGSFQLATDPIFQLGGSFEVASRSGGGVDTRLSINPAVLVAGFYGERVLIHGATRNDPFTLNTTGPWTASVEVTNNLNLLNLVEMGYGGLFAPITLSGNGTNVSFTVGFGPGAGFTLLPGSPTLRKDITLSAGAAGSLTMASNRRFMMTAQLGGTAFSFNNISVPAGATLTASNEGVTISWFINNGSTAAAISVATNGSVTFSGNTDLPPLDAGIFRLSGLDGGDLQGSFNNDGFAVGSGALLKLNADWLDNQALAVTAFTISNNGAIQISVTNSPGSLAFAGYPFDLTQFTFSRASTNSGGLAALGLVGTLKTNILFPGFPSLSFTGSITSAGEVTLRSGAASTVLFGFPVQNLSNVLAIAAGQFAAQLQMQFRLGDSSAFWSALGSNWFTGSLASDGRAAFQATSPSIGFAGFSINNALFSFELPAPAMPPAVRLEGDVAISGFSLLHLAGSFAPSGSASLTVLTPNPFPFPQFNANVVLTLGNAGMSASGTLRLPPLPNVSLSGNIQPTGAYSLTGTAGGTLAGFSLNSGTVTLQRAAAQSATVSISGASLVLPGFGARTFNGSFTNNGTFLITHSASGGVTFTNTLPVPGMSDNVAFRLSHTGMTLNGTLLANTGVLSTVLPRATITGVLSLTADGQQSIVAQLNIAPITNGVFRIASSGGGDFIVTLDNAGLHTAGGAELSYSNYFTAPVPLPAIDIAANGSFAISVGEPVPASLTMKGFGLTDAVFVLQRNASGLLSVPSFEASVNLTVFGRAASINGALNADGTFSLTGVFGSAVSLASVIPPLPVASLGANAMITFNQSALTITGSLIGGVLDSMSGNASGILNVTPTAVSLGGSVTLPPIVLGAFRIEPADGAANISASWNNNVLRLPTNLRFRFSGNTLTTNATDIAVGSDGSFSLTRTGVSVTLAGFAINNGTLAFSRTAVAVSAGLTSASFSVPGLDSVLTVTVNGALSSDGNYTFASTATATTGPTFGGATPLVKLNLGASVGVTNGMCVVNGTFDVSQGVLSLVSEIGSVTGGFRITASPSVVVTAFGLVTHAPIDFGTIDLQPLGGGNFVSTIDNSGLHIPAGAQVYFNNALLGSFSLPSFAIPANGAFSRAFGPVNLAIEGFSLNANANLARTALGVTTIAITGGTSLAIPGLNTSVNVTGTMTNNGTFLIANNAAGSFALQNLPVTAMANTAVVFARTIGAATLRLTGDVSGGVLTGSGSGDLRLANANVTVAVSSSGGLTLNASVTARYFAAGVFTVEGNGNFTDISANLNNNFLVLTGARLRASASSILGATVNLPSISVPISGEFDVPVTLPATSVLSVRSFNFTNVSLNLRRFAPNSIGARDLRVQNFAGRLGISNFTQPFSGGVILSDGSPIFDWSGSLTLADFAAADGQLSLRAGGMTARGAFDLTALGITFNSSFHFSGSLQPNGSFTLSGNGSLNISGLQMPAATFTLSSSGVTGSPTLRYGDTSGLLDFTPPSFTLTKFAGASYSASRSYNQSLDIFFSSPFEVASVNTTISLNSSGGTSFNVRCSGSITAFGNTQNFGAFDIGSDLEFVREFPPGTQFTPPGPCVRFDMAPLRAKMCGNNWP